MSKKPAARCGFCPNPANSREHIFPKWLRPYVPKLDHNAHMASFTGLVPTLGGLLEWRKRGKLHRPGSPYSQRLRVVCIKCNTGWMAKLQERVKPILVPFLEDQWPDVPPPDHAALAAWATMTTTVIEFAHLETMASTPSCRAALKEHGIPPDRWFVFLGQYSGGGVWNHGCFNHFGLGGSPIRGQIKNGVPSIPTPNALAPWHLAQSTAFAIGKLFFLTFSSRVPVELDPFDFARQNGLRCLWPSQGLTITDTQRVLDDAAADLLSRSFLPPDARRRAVPAWTRL